VSLLGDEPLDVACGDLVRVLVAELRRDVNGEVGLVVGDGRALAPEPFEMEDQPLPRLAQRDGLSHRRRDDFAHQLPQPCLRLLARQPVAAAGLADRAELALDLAAVDAPLAVPSAPVFVD